MKKIPFLLILAFFSSCVSPTDSSIQTAIAKTEQVDNQQAYPTKELVMKPTATSFTEQYINCSDAPVGENVTCKIARAFCSYEPSVNGKPTFCNDAPYPNNNFTLLVWGENWSKYDGQCLIVAGFNHLYKGKPEIEVSSESQVSQCK